MADNKTTQELIEINRKLDTSLKGKFKEAMIRSERASRAIRAAGMYAQQINNLR